MTIKLNINDFTLALSLRRFATGARLRINRGGNVSTYRTSDAKDFMNAISCTAALWAVVPLLLACGA